MWVTCSGPLRASSMIKGGELRPADVRHKGRDTTDNNRGLDRPAGMQAIIYTKRLVNATNVKSRCTHTHVHARVRTRTNTHTHERTHTTPLTVHSAFPSVQEVLRKAVEEGSFTRTFSMVRTTVSCAGCPGPRHIIPFHSIFLRRSRGSLQT